MLWDGLVKKNLTRTRSRTLQHRSEDELKRVRERVEREGERERRGGGESNGARTSTCTVGVIADNNIRIG